MSEYSESMQFIDLAAQQKLIRPHLEAAILNVLDHGKYIMGPEVHAFEADLRKFSGANHALTCANGTDALTLVLMAWGVGTGDAVFVPSFTYVATAEAPAQLGATPFFVDVDKDSFNMDPNSLKQAILECRKLGLRPAAVIPVDLFGQPCEVDQIMSISHAEKMKVLVDGAQSFGGSYAGRRVGVMGDATTTSFFPAKPLGCYGDGGAVFTQCDEDAHLINSIRLHGKGAQKYDNVRVGVNSRLDTIQAAILIEKLKIFPDELTAREEAANRYSSILSYSDEIICPVVKPDTTSAWAQYTLKVPHNREKLKRKLAEFNVPSVIYYPIPLCSQEGYKKFPRVSSGTQNSKELANEVLSLPMHPYLELEQIDYIANILIE
jgi:dTDP-4-amino-4,6-dideoxygalactose transaminase